MRELFAILIVMALSLVATKVISLFVQIEPPSMTQESDALNRLNLADIADRQNQKQRNTQ